MLDGASKIKTFFNITLPQIKEMTLVGTIITVIGAFKVFDEVYIMTNGGPGRSTEVLGTMLYRAAFRNDEMGYASTIGTVIFVITLTLSLLQIKLGKSGQEV
jgi:raffinose/stachyose/melibiose transport system permease protein